MTNLDYKMESHGFVHIKNVFPRKSIEIAGQDDRVTDPEIGRPVEEELNKSAGDRKTREGGRKVQARNSAAEQQSSTGERPRKG